MPDPMLSRPDLMAVGYEVSRTSPEAERWGCRKVPSPVAGFDVCWGSAYWSQLSFAAGSAYCSHLSGIGVVPLERLYLIVRDVVGFAAIREPRRPACRAFSLPDGGHALHPRLDVLNRGLQVLRALPRSIEGLVKLFAQVLRQPSPSMGQSHSRGQHQQVGA